MTSEKMSRSTLLSCHMIWMIFLSSIAITSAQSRQCSFGYYQDTNLETNYCQPCPFSNCATCACSQFEFNCTCNICFNGNSPSTNGTCSNDGYGDDCFKSSNVSSAIQLCDTARLNSYEYTYMVCRSFNVQMRCYYKVLSENCGIQIARTQIVKYIVEKQFWPWFYSCTFDWSAIITNTTAGRPCDDIGYHQCLPSASTVFDSLRSAVMPYSYSEFETGSAFCSNWSSISACSTAGTVCSLDGLKNDTKQYYRVNSHSYKRLSAFEVGYNDLCSSDLSIQRCMSTALHQDLKKCAAIVDFKQTYIIIYNRFNDQIKNDSCAATLKALSCAYNASFGRCDETATELLIHLQRHILWISYDVYFNDCDIDFNKVKAEKYTDDPYNQLVYCLSQTKFDGINIWLFLENSYSYQFRKKTFEQWADAIMCMGCGTDSQCVEHVKRFLQPILTKHYYYRFYYQHSIYNGFSTLQKSFILRGNLPAYKIPLMQNIPENEWTKLSPCFYSLEKYLSECSTRWDKQMASQQTFNQCMFFDAMFKCLFDKISTNCSRFAANLYTELRFDVTNELMKVFYNCSLDINNVLTPCNETSCTNYLPASTVYELAIRMQAGSLSLSNLTGLCALVSRTSQCLQQQQLQCDLNLLKYAALIEEIVPNLCSNVTQKETFTSQQCVRASSSVQTALTAFIEQTQTAEAYCRSARTLLEDVYNALSSTCIFTDLDSTVTYAAHLQQLFFLASNFTVIANCTKSLYPSNTSPPQFTGPNIVQNVYYNGAGPYVDFNFVCRVNYFKLTVDDGSRFEVVLTADGQRQSQVRTTNATQLNVIFTSQDIRELFGKTVACATRSYWVNQPLVKSDFVISSRSYFVGINVSSEAMTIYNKNVVQIFESTPYETVHFKPTIPVTCPPCSMAVRIARRDGLSLMTCILTFRASELPYPNKTIRFRVVQTLSSNSRPIAIDYSRVVSEMRRSV